MKHFTLLKLVFLSVILLIGNSSLHAQEALVYSTGFESAEGFVAGTTYNNTTVAYTGPAGSQWGTYFGTPSTTSPLVSLQSMQMRWYTTTPSSLGYTFTNFDLANVSRVTFKAANTAGINLIVSYSTDGGVTFTGDQTFSLTTTSADYEYVVSATGAYPNVRIKFAMTYTTAPTGTSRLYLDAVNIYGITSASTVATPIFSPVAGNYVGAQDVTLSTTTGGASIYYTTDGSDPDNSKTLYTAGTPIHVATSTTIKAIAYASGLTTSAIATATYNFPVDVATLAALQSYMPASNGSTPLNYRYTGSALVTCSFTTAAGVQSVYMQDATGGYLVYDTNKKLSTTYNLGDIVTGFIGQVTNYNNLPESYPVADFTVSSSGNPVTPTTITMADVSSNLLKLVKIAGVSFTAADGTAAFAAATNYAITDASGAATFRAPFAFDYIGSVLPSSTDLVCIVSKNSTTYQVFARSKQDISILAGINTPEIGSIKLYSDAGKIVVVGANQGDLIQVFTATGSLVKKAFAQGNDEFTMPKGLYIVKIGKDAAKVVVK